MQQINVTLGFAFDSLVERDGKLYFTGTALEYGLWTGTKGGSLYWPVGPIHDGMEGFDAKPITCMHGSAVGTVLGLRKTAEGFKSSGVITSQRVIEAIKNKKLRGLSVTTDVMIDPVRRTVLKLVNQRDISVVDEPACRTCMLENTWDDNMAKAKIETENAAVAELSLEQEPVATVVETVDTAELAAEVAESPTEVAVEMSDLIAKVAEQELQIAELSAELSVTKAENETYRGQVRAEMEQAIMSIDPNVNMDALKEFSDVALSVYFTTASKLAARPKVAPALKNVKISAPSEIKPVVKAAPKAIDSNKVMAQYLKGIPKEK